jgi:hypothetical protein
MSRIGKCVLETAAIVLIVASTIVAINLQSATVIITVISTIQRHLTTIKAGARGSFATATATIMTEIVSVTANESEVEVEAAIENADRERVDIQQVEAVVRAVATKRSAVRNRVDPSMSTQKSSLRRLMASGDPLLILLLACSHL